MSSNTSHKNPIQREWYIEVAGQKTGPFPAEAVRDLLLEKEILPDQVIFATDEPELRMTVQELADLFPSSALPLPIRPSEVPKASGAAVDPQDDPSVGLYDTLMAATKRTRSHSDLDGESPSLPTGSATRQLPGWVLAVALASLGIAALVGLANLLKTSGKQLDPPKETPPVASHPAAESHDSFKDKEPKRPSPPNRPPPSHATPPPNLAKPPVRESGAEEREKEREREERERELQRERDRDRRDQPGNPGDPNIPGTDGSTSPPPTPPPIPPMPADGQQIPIIDD